MMFNIIKQHLKNIPGWRTDRKIVVLESDDWGSIRMPSREIYNQFLSKNIRVDKLCYNRFDTIANEDDLSFLFGALDSIKDKHGRPAVLTANTIVANPDFERIKATGYSDYFYEPFTATLQRYHGPKVFRIWQSGMEAGLFKPQFHGREHLNVPRWMHALRQDMGQVRLAFDMGMFDLSTSLVIGENSFMEALNLESLHELEDQKSILLEGLDLFESRFGYRSTTFIAPCYTWSSELEEPLLQAGIRAWQGTWFQREPLPGKTHRFRKRFHYIGQRNQAGQYYLVRNAAFEPSERPNVNWVEEVLRRLEVIFRMGKPAIIGTHRVNFIGAIDPGNRDRNLILFKTLLKMIVTKFPDVEFLSSDELVQCMEEKGHENQS